VSLVYRNDDGVDARTLARVRRTNQRKQGHDFCPRFCGIFQDKIQSRAMLWPIVKIIFRGDHRLHPVVARRKAASLGNMC